MRVLHVGKFYPPHPGGIESVSADLCAGLVARGVDVSMLAHAEPGTMRTRRAVVDGVDVTQTACFGRALYAPVSPTFPWHLRRMIAERRPDLLHLHVPNTSAFWPLMFPSLRRIPWIVHWHADIPRDSRSTGLRLGYGVYRPWERALLRRSRAVIATSPDYLDSSEALAPYREKTHVIPLGIGPLDIGDPQADAHNDTNIQWPSHGLRILAVGRLSYFKGFDVLLRAVAATADCSLVLVGDGECAPALRALAQELGIDPRVHFTGRIDMDSPGRARLAAIYSRADVFCLPSTERAESFGVVLLEAMRAGVPTIASAIPGSGVNYVVRDGETGLLTPPGDAAALATALARLRDDGALRRHLGEAGRRRWRAEFTLDASVARTITLYESVLGASERRGAATPAA
jgi:glycosyltransferase involved in cell wall biosynthesis